jgi:lipopolysaccharide transport system ATP-binding protein
LTNAVTAALRRRPRPLAEDERLVWALSDVSFEVQPGEAVGVIGPNGSGKSTLLKILTRITYPSLGTAEFCGRVGALLEVGAGFHPELTGRENVYFSGAVLGMKKAEIKRRFDEIVAFAEVERFLDTPVKRYSSGMYVRLAFAVAAHLEPDILLVDEVLAVGDLAFQKKCLARLERSMQDGRTILFVSHNMAAVRSLCTKALLLQGGRVRMIGSPDEAIAQYAADKSKHQGHRAWPNGFANPGISELSISSVSILDPSGRPSACVDARQGFQVEIRYTIKHPLDSCIVGFQLTSLEGTMILEGYDRRTEELPGQQSPGRYVSRCTIPGRLLKPGTYILSMTASICGQRSLAQIDHALSVEIREGQTAGAKVSVPRRAVVQPDLPWSVEYVPRDILNLSDQASEKPERRLSA